MSPPDTPSDIFVNFIKFTCLLLSSIYTFDTVPHYNIVLFYIFRSICRDRRLYFNTTHCTFCSLMILPKSLVWNGINTNIISMHCALHGNLN